MKNFLWMSLCALGLSACSPNCVVTHFAPYQVVKDQKAGHIQLVQVGGVMTDNFLRGRALLINTSSDARNFTYHFSWVSADGMPQGENTPWQPVSMGPKFSQIIQGVAPTSQASAFELQVCEVKG